MSIPATASHPQTRVFGIPLGGFGLFASLLLSLALGFIAFFATAFLSIFGLLFYGAATHHAVNYAASYRVFALPAGIVVLALSLVLFGSLWVRRQLGGR